MIRSGPQFGSEVTSSRDTRASRSAGRVRVASLAFVNATIFFCCYKYLLWPDMLLTRSNLLLCYEAADLVLEDSKKTKILHSQLQFNKDWLLVLHRRRGGWHLSITSQPTTCLVIVGRKSRDTNASHQPPFIEGI